ncbi:RNA processing factor [Lithospermum erythrorhizon]|uniref:tRNA-dihydrouridine(47) synthase [NAD(P)(+)] n=1 Tax=Lithospermum erythrorhizon TaxID=34254 RepID=A0AAV3R4P1_LITER
MENPKLFDEDGGSLNAEELVAKGIAPIKREFIQTPTDNRNCNNITTEDDVVVVGQPKPVPILKEKKSKRQLKRERRQERTSPLHICSEVAKKGKVTACRYGEKCRFSHDLEAFKAMKPEDLEGNCPFLKSEGPCPYGLACRFSGTHKEDSDSNGMNAPRLISEVNTFNKDVQKLLWKNKMKFPKAEATLKALGLVGKKKFVEKDEDDLIDGLQPVDKNGSSGLTGNPVINVEEEAEEEKLVGKDVNDDDKNRPVKKAKTADGPEEEQEKSLEQSDAIPSDGHVALESDLSLKIHPREKKIIDFREKLYLAPLTTVGTLPFRRLCKKLGADVTCGEMAMCTNLLQGQASEWALLRRHSSEDLFGVQICGAYPDTVARTVELIERECSVDFIDINMGCPIDIVVNKGAGSALLTKPMRMKSIVQAASGTVDTPITIKVRTGYVEGKNRIDSLIADIGNWGAAAVTIHGRSRQQRYSKLADWEYINRCARLAPNSLQVLGNGDVFSHLDWNKHKSDCPELSTCMIARGALIKPWIFTEIKEQRHWDISSTERLNILKEYVHFGLDHWGSDSKGVETVRHFLLEWLSYTCRYIPVGLLDVVPQQINWRQPPYYGRDELETLMGSDSAADWIRISEMLLGKVPADFTFAPKHKSNAYDRAENG